MLISYILLNSFKQIVYSYWVSSTLTFLCFSVSGEMGTKIKDIDTDLFTILCLETECLTLTRYLINICGISEKMNDII